MRDMFINILLLSNFCLIGCTNYETDTTSNQNYYTEYLTKHSRSESTNHNEFIANNNLKRKTCETSEAEVNSDKEKNASNTNQKEELLSLKVATNKFKPSRKKFSDRFDPPTIVFSDDKRYDMWHRATNVFNTICKKYFEFTQISYLNFDEDEYLKTIKTVESADLFYSNFVSFLNLKEKGFFPKSVNETKLDIFKGLYEDIRIEKLMSDIEMKQLNGSIYYFSKDLDLRYLTEILLSKIYLNKVKLVEIKSIILIIFYYYPTGLEESKESEEKEEYCSSSRLMFLIAKTISLIDIANIFLKKDPQILTEYLNERINQLLKKYLLNFLYDYSSIKTHMTKYNEINNILKDHKNPNSPFKRDDFMFLYYLVGEYKSIEKNYILPISGSQQQDETDEKIKLITNNALNRFDQIGKFIIENTYRISAYDRSKELKYT